MKLDLSDSLVGARSLLGWKLIHSTDQGTTAGIIVETEAYHMDDEASHAYGGERVRNGPLFRPQGTIYVYFTYGMHYCFNIVTGSEGSGQGVLIRALEPVDGLDLMKRRRRQNTLNALCNGPAKLVQAMGVTKELNGKTIWEGQLKLEKGYIPANITQTTRVGISKAANMPWRFYVSNSKYISKR